MKSMTICWSYIARCIIMWKVILLSIRPHAIQFFKRTWHSSKKVYNCTIITKDQAVKWSYYRKWEYTQIFQPNIQGIIGSQKIDQQNKCATFSLKEEDEQLIFFSEFTFCTFWSQCSKNISLMFDRKWCRVISKPFWLHKIHTGQITQLIHKVDPVK